MCGPELSTQLASGSEAYTISPIPSDADGVKWRSRQWVCPVFSSKMVFDANYMVCRFNMILCFFMKK